MIQDAIGGLDEAFVKVTFEEELATTLHGATPGTAASNAVYGKWVNHSAASRVDTETIVVEALKTLHPDHSLVITRSSVLSFPGAMVMPDPTAESIVRARFVPFRRNAPVPGVVAEEPVFKAFVLAWKDWEYTVYACQFWPSPFSLTTQYFILHKGPEQRVKELLVAAGAWEMSPHNEIWVYEGNGMWRKDAGLWTEVQKANWDDVILKHTFKMSIRNDIDGFYSQEKVYTDLGIPWKRGIILYGPPGNGKTISLKAIMKTVPAIPLYVRTFQHYLGPEEAMRDVFAKARMESPSLLILEDLDTLVGDSNRSFFLNQIDGLESNNGILVIGTTNYLDRLDPSLSKRPSRFDRKFIFSAPDKEERVLYCRYWQKKLEDNKDLDFPDTLCNTIAVLTDGFSFAYLKEVFLSTLVLIATGTETRPFEESLKSTIKSLREQLEDQSQSVPVQSLPVTLRQLVGSVRLG